MRATADVVVIGGGVMGCSILFNLARLGITNTVLLEKDILNGGSTGRSQSICRMHYSNPVTATMAWESLGRLHPLRGSGRRAVGVHGDRLPGGGQGGRPARAGAQLRHAVRAGHRHHGGHRRRPARHRADGVGLRGRGHGLGAAIGLRGPLPGNVILRQRGAAVGRRDKPGPAIHGHRG